MKKEEQPASAKAFSKAVTIATEEEPRTPKDDLTTSVDRSEQPQTVKAAAMEEKKEEKKVAVAPKRPAKEYKGGKKAMTWVGFQQLKEGSRIFIKTSALVDYRISESGPDTLIVELHDTFIPVHNNRRPLDTSYFPTAVAMVTPTSGKDGVKIEIKLKERVPFVTKQEDNSLFVDFQKPGKAATEPPKPKKWGAPKKAR